MGSATILIIEDHASVRMLLARVLEEVGYQVYEAANGRQGLEQFRAQPVNLVITDLEMPEMNGLEVILKLTRAFFRCEGHGHERALRRRPPQGQAPRRSADLSETA